MASQHLEAVSSGLPGILNQPHHGAASFHHLNVSQISHRSSTTAVASTTSAESRQPSLASHMLPTNGSSPSSIATQYPKEKSPSKFSTWDSKWIINWWGIEIACLFIAVLSLVAIVIALERHKNQPMPQWHFGITLNSLISIFATIGQMAMAKPLVECISQLKWLWFERKEQLSRFQDFDDASRGLVGSLALLWKLHGMHLVSLGAAIMVASAAFGPFVQQVVTYPSRLHPVANATVPQVFNFTAFGGEGINPSPVTQAAIEEGITPGNFTLSAISPTSCSTSNCSWTEYLSLGMCASVSDMSSTIIHNACNLTAFDNIFQSSGLANPGYPCFNYTLPELSINGDGLLYTGNATLSNAIFDDIALSQGPMAIMSMNPSFVDTGSVSTVYLMYQPGFSTTSFNSTLPSPIAYALNLNLCIQTYKTIESNGEVNTTLLSSRIIETPFESSFNITYDSINIIANDTYVSIDGNTFGISSAALAVFSQITGPLYSVCYELLPNPALNWSESLYCNNINGFPTLQLLVNSTDPLFAVTEQWENLAISLTNAFRSGSGGDTAIGNFNGTAFAPVPYVETNYLWLILPISLVALTFVFLVATILKSQRLGSRVWKSSNMAILQGLHPELHAKLGGMSSITEMDEKVKDVNVRFNLNLRNAKGEHDVEYRLVESKQEEYWRG